MAVAAIDIGTNSVKLLVGRTGKRKQIEPLAEEVVVTRIGERVAVTGELAEAAIERTLGVLQKFALRAADLGAKEVRCVGTSALRDAKNREEFCRRAWERAGLKVQVISGEEEARLTFLGAMSGMRGRRPTLVLDVGGGSSEVILGGQRGPQQRISLDVGAVRMTERYLRHDPIPMDEWLGMMSYLSQELGKKLRRIDTEGCRVVGVGGTFSNLASMHMKLAKLDPARIDGCRLRQRDVRNLITDLRGMRLEHRKQVPGLEPERADIIVAGLSIVDSLISALTKRVLQVSRRGLRHGLILSNHV